MSMRDSKTLALTLLVGVLFVSGGPSAAQDASRVVRSRNAEESKTPTTRTSTTRRTSRETKTSRSRYPSRSTRNSYSKTRRDASASDDRRGETVSRSRYDRTRNAGGEQGSSQSSGQSSGSDSGWTLSKSQYDQLKDKIRDLKIENDQLEAKIEAKGRHIQALSQALTPAINRISVLESQVQTLNAQAPSGQAISQINSIKQQISDIKKVINTIPGVSI